jgi:pyruvate-formate lyase
VLDADFAGCASEQALMLNAPKYGNDTPIADAMAMQVHNQICHVTRNQRDRTSLHSYLVVIINNHANTILGRKTAASADGRQSGSRMANANNPAPGMDKNGLTALFNSMVKLDPTIHAGSVQNMKFSSELFTGAMRPKLEALLRTYFVKGGTQAMISVVRRGDLEAALREPEKYQNLMVRVGGFSARFVELMKDVQLEILDRTLY